MIHLLCFIIVSVYFLRQTDGHRDREKDRQRDRQTGRETNRPKLQSDPSQPEGHKQENDPCLLIQERSLFVNTGCVVQAWIVLAFIYFRKQIHDMFLCYCEHDNYVKIS